MEGRVRKYSAIGLTAVAIAVMGGLAFALPGAYAQQVDEIFVSAANPMFANTFAGGQIVEVSVNSPQFRADNAFEDAYEPIVAVDGNPLKMTQAANGAWYGYFVDAAMAAAAHENGLDYGAVWEDMSFNRNAHTLYVDDGTRNVLANPALVSRNVVIQAFDLPHSRDMVVELENGRGAQAVTLTFDTVEDYASLLLDRHTYPLGAHVHITIADTWMNVDPTAEDEWVLTGDDRRFYRVTPYQLEELEWFGEPIPEVPKDELMCDDNCAFSINPGRQGQTVLFQQDNDDSLDGIRALGPMAVTFTETNDNTGVFTNTDDFGVSNLATAGDVGLMGRTATIHYNDAHTSILIGFDFATVDIRPVGHTWNSGEAIPVIVTDMDANKNGMDEEYLAVNDPGVGGIPTLITGSPIVITEDTLINAMPVADMAYDPVAKRAMVDGAVIGDRLVVSFDKTVNLPVVDTVFNYINYDLSSIGGVDRVTMCGNDLDAGSGYGVNYKRLDAADVNGCRTVAFELSRPAESGGTYPVVVDFMSFGHTDDGVQSSERVADQIIRMEAEETGRNTGVFEGTLEFSMVTQFSIWQQSTYDNVTPNSDAPSFVAIEDMTGKDAPRISYLDVGADGVAAIMSDQEEAPSHSGVVTFNSDRYKVADAVVITLDDADLNTDSDIIDVYVVDTSTGVIGGGGITILDVTFDDQGWSSQHIHPNCLLDLKSLTPHAGLDATKFALVETGKGSGVFVGSFPVPSHWCRPGSESPETAAGLDLEVNYLDFRDASGEMIEVGASATVGANTGSVSLDRGVYPVPFGEPRDFNNVGDIAEELKNAERVMDTLVALEGLDNEITRIEEMEAPANSANLVKDDDQWVLFNKILREEANDNMPGGLDDPTDAQRQAAMNAVTWDDIRKNLSDKTQAARDDVDSMRNIEDIYRDKVRADTDLMGVELDGQSPDGASYFPVHPRAFGSYNGIAYVPNGDLTIHVRVTDADYDVSASGLDTISQDGDGPVKVFVKRGSETCMVATAGSDDQGIEEHGDGCNGVYHRHGPMHEIAPGAGVFEADMTVRFSDGPGDARCPDGVDGCILQGDIIQAEYADPFDSSGGGNAVTDSATFALRNAVLQSDKNSYAVGTDMVLTLIEPDFNLDSGRAETYTLDLIEWNSDAAILAMGSRGGSAGAFDPEPDSFRETGDSTGIFQTIVEIPEELEGFALEQNESITLEYVDWGPAGADYVGDESENVVLAVGTSDFAATADGDAGSTPLDRTAHSRYEYWTDMEGMEPYAYPGHVVEVDTAFPYEELAVGDVIAYEVSEPGAAGKADAIARVVNLLPGAVLAQLDDPEYAGNAVSVFKTGYVGLVNAVIVCIPSDPIYDEALRIEGPYLVAEFPDGSVESWAGKWVKGHYGHCNLDHTPVDTQARFVEKFAD